MKPRIPRKVKKWVKRSCHFAGMHRGLPTWTQDKWSRHLMVTRQEMTWFHRSGRRGKYK